MSKRFIIPLASVVLGLVILAATFLAGVRVGATESAWLQSPVNAALLVRELRTLRAGKTEGLVSLKELELDTQVLLLHQLSTNGHPWLFWPQDVEFGNNRFFREVALYRKEFPAVIPGIQIQGTDEIHAEMRANGAKIQHMTDKLVREFGQ